MKTNLLLIGFLTVFGLFTGINNSQKAIPNVLELKAEITKQKENDSLKNLITQKAIKLNKINSHVLTKNIDTLKLENNILLSENKTLLKKVVKLENQLQEKPKEIIIYDTIILNK